VTYQLLVCAAAAVKLLGNNMKIIDTEALLDANEGGGLEVNRENYVYVVLSLDCRPKSEDKHS
jgi:hypothetical protein